MAGGGVPASQAQKEVVELAEMLSIPVATSLSGKATILDDHPLAVGVVGLEGVGHKNPEQLPTLVTTTWGSRQLKVPFIAAGGIGDAHGFLGALGMGADGIMMGTAFMATRECPINEATKEAIVRSRPDDPQLRNWILASANPEKYAEVKKMRDELPLGEWLRKLGDIRDKQADLESAAARSGQPALRGGRVISLAVGVIDRVPTVKEFIDSIIHRAEEILDSWQFLKTR